MSSDPQLLPVQPHLPPEVALQARLRLLDAAEVGGRSDLPVLVIAPAASWSRLLPSTRVAAPVGFQGAERQSMLPRSSSSHGAPRRSAARRRLQRWAGRIRGGSAQGRCCAPESQSADFCRVLSSVTPSAMPAAETADFREAGLTHLTAVSGANLAVVVAAVFGLLRWTPLGIRGRAFSAVVAARLCVARAAVAERAARGGMGLLALAAIAFGRPRAVLPALLATSTALVLFDPTLATARVSRFRSSRRSPCWSSRPAGRRRFVSG